MDPCTRQWLSCTAMRGLFLSNTKQIMTVSTLQTNGIPQVTERLLDTVNHSDQAWKARARRPASQIQRNTPPSFAFARTPRGRLVTHIQIHNNDLCHLSYDRNFTKLCVICFKVLIWPQNVSASLILWSWSVKADKVHLARRFGFGFKASMASVTVKGEKKRGSSPITSISHADCNIFCPCHYLLYNNSKQFLPSIWLQHNPKNWPRTQSIQTEESYAQHAAIGDPASSRRSKIHIRNPIPSCCGSASKANVSASKNKTLEASQNFKALRMYWCR